MILLVLVCGSGICGEADSPDLFFGPEVVPDLSPDARRKIEAYTAEHSLQVMFFPEPLSPWETPVNIQYTLIHLVRGYELIAHTFGEGSEWAEFPTAMAYLNGDFQVQSYGEVLTGECVGATELVGDCRKKAQWLVDDAFECFAAAVSME